MFTKSKTIIDEEFGAIKLTKYKNSKNIRLIVKKNSQVKISLPSFLSYQEALKFLYSKKSWIQAQLKANPSKALTEEQKIFSSFLQLVHNQILLVKAREYIPLRLNQLAIKYNLRYRRLSLRNTKTRWGSCSSVNNINISIQVMNLSDELIDYVLLHELAHTIHKNHSAQFWECLSTLLGQDAKVVDKGLKKYKL